MMVSKRDLAAAVVARSGLLSCIRSLRHYYLKDIRVMAYHRVLPRIDKPDFPFDAELISAWADEFDWQMKYVASGFDVLTCRDIVEIMERGEKLPRRPLVITFDDGFADNYDHAFPILRAHNLSAVIFLSTGYVGGNKVFWFDWISYALSQTDCLHVPAEIAGVELSLPNTGDFRNRAVKLLLRHLKGIPNDERLAKISRLREFLGFSVPDNQRHKCAVLNWDQVRTMASAGIEFGSHTVSHPVLSRVLDDAELDYELQASRQEIERHLNQAVVSIAYPVGGKSAIDDRVTAAVAKAGYKIGLTYQTGLNPVEDWHPFYVKRLRVERYMQRDMFRAMLESPELFTLRS